jgi:hypothetical protein
LFSLLERRNKSFQDLDAFRVWPVVQALTDEVSIGMVDWLWGEEIILLEGKARFEVFRHLRRPMSKQSIRAVLDNKREV